MMNSRIWCLPGAALLVTCLLLGPAGAQGPILKVYHIPEAVTPNDDVVIYIEVENQSAVSRVWLTCCQLDPYLCFVPKQMAFIGGDTFATNLGRFPDGMELKYNITVQMRDGTNHTTPDHHISVRRPAGNGDGGLNNTTNQTGEQPSPAGRSPWYYVAIGGAILALALASYPLRAKKRALGAISVSIAALAVLGAYLFITSPVGVKEAPDFSLRDVYGTMFNLSDYKGRVVLLELTAIDCPACNIVLDELMSVRAKYSSSEVSMVSVFIYPEELETEEQVRAYRETHGANWTFAKDSSDMVHKYGVAQIPKLVVIDRRGNIVYEATGEVRESDLSPHIDEALAGRAASEETVGSSLLAGLGLAGLAALAGAASFFSPCSFPMLPGYMTFYLKSAGERVSYKRAASGGTVAALGILSVYISIGAVVVALGSAVLPYVSLLQPIIGAMLLPLGVLLLLPISFSTGRILKRIQGAQEGRGHYAGLFLYGMGYAAASQGCTAPVFAAVILFALLSGSLIVGVGVLLLYAVVAALLMVAVTLLVAGLRKGVLSRLKASTEVIKKTSGVVLILVGVYLLLYYAWAFLI
ncbi:MAG: redoxin family protein [Thermoplasmatota archaeon]